MNDLNNVELVQELISKKDIPSWVKWAFVFAVARELPDEAVNSLLKSPIDDPSDFFLLSASLGSIALAKGKKDKSKNSEIYDQIKTFLLRCLRHKHPFVRKYAIMVLVKIDYPEVLDSIRQNYMKEEDPEVRCAYVLNLETCMKKYMALNILYKALEDNYFIVRNAAIYALEPHKAASYDISRKCDSAKKEIEEFNEGKRKIADEYWRENRLRRQNKIKIYEDRITSTIEEKDMEKSRHFQQYIIDLMIAEKDLLLLYHMIIKLVILYTVGKPEALSIINQIIDNINPCVLDRVSRFLETYVKSCGDLKTLRGRIESCEALKKWREERPKEKEVKDITRYPTWET